MDTTGVEGTGVVWGGGELRGMPGKGGNWGKPRGGRVCWAGGDWGTPGEEEAGLCLGRERGECMSRLVALV